MTCFPGVLVSIPPGQTLISTATIPQQQPQPKPNVPQVSVLCLF